MSLTSPCTLENNSTTGWNSLKITSNRWIYFHIARRCSLIRKQQKYCSFAGALISVLRKFYSSILISNIGLIAWLARMLKFQIG